MPDPITLTAIGAGVGIANIVSDFFLRSEQSAQRELDRMESVRLRDALNRIADAIQNDTGNSVALEVLGLSTSFVQTLQNEAAAMSEVGIRPAFEVYDHGVGLVHRRAESDAVLVWLEFDYPASPPKLLVACDGEIGPIPFEDGAWDASSWNLTDVLLAIPESATTGNQS